MLSTDYTLRQLTPADALLGAELSPRVGWTQTAEEWTQSIAWGGENAWGIFHKSGALVASSIGITYSSTLAWIGLVITDPDHQRRGLARTIVQHTLDDLIARGVQSIMLDASTLGYPLYNTMGFQTLYTIDSWLGTFETPTPPEGVLPMDKTHFTQVVALDAKWMGIERPQILYPYWKAGGWVIEHDGEIKGYAFSKPSGKATRLGPWYADTPANAERLMQMVINQYPGQTIRADVPSINLNAREMVEHHGFKTSRFVYRMVYGNPAPGDMAKQYAISSFGTG